MAWNVLFNTGTASSPWETLYDGSSEVEARSVYATRCEEMLPGQCLLLRRPDGTYALQHFPPKSAPASMTREVGGFFSRRRK